MNPWRPFNRPGKDKASIREHEELPGQVRGHEARAFFNLIVQALGRYVSDVLAVLAEDGLVARDDEGVAARVIDAEGFLGSAALTVEVETPPASGLPSPLPLR